MHKITQTFLEEINYNEIVTVEERTSAALQVPYEIHACGQKGNSGSLALIKFNNKRAKAA